MAEAEPSRAPRPAAYRFAGVVLDLHRGCLQVDGAEVAAAPLLLQLLQCLCESEGRLLPRQLLFDTLWPGGQVVSDAALSQLIWRLRAALGPYGERIATVRGSGVRLDAPVEVEFALPRNLPVAVSDVAAASGAVSADAPAAAIPAAASAAEPLASAGQESVVPAVLPAVPSGVSADTAAPVAHSAISPSRSRRIVIAAVLLAAALGLGAWWWLSHDNPLISDGYALHAADLQASRADTVQIAATAFAAEEAGDRERAAALLRSLHESDPATPVPAAMLAWWTSYASPEEAQVWATAARARLRAGSSPYLRLYVDYFLARSLQQRIRGPLNALLDLRPQAWHFQYTRAHDQLAQREFAGALRSLQQMPLDLPDTQVLADVLVDRISLGDGTAAGLALAQPRITGDALLSGYVRGRIAYSQGKLAEAIAAWDESARSAAEIRQYQRQRTASELASLAAFELRAADASARLGATRRLCQAQQRRDCETAMLGFLTVLAAEQGDAGRAAATLAEAWQLNPDGWARPSLLLLALEQELPLPGKLDAVVAELAGQPAFAGVAELLRGWQALLDGQTEAAARYLQQAREQGVEQTYHAEDAALLGARLGQRAAACRIDPPYPNMLRASACRKLGALEKTKGIQSAGKP